VRGAEIRRRRRAGPRAWTRSARNALASVSSPAMRTVVPTSPACRVRAKVVLNAFSTREWGRAAAISVAAVESAATVKESKVAKFRAPTPIVTRCHAPWWFLEDRNHRPRSLPRSGGQTTSGRRRRRPRFGHVVATPPPRRRYRRGAESDVFARPNLASTRAGRAAPDRSGTAASFRCPRARRCGSARRTGRRRRRTSSGPWSPRPGRR